MKTLRSAALVAALSLAFAAPSFALEMPTKSVKDHRVRYVEYDPANVIQLDTVIGIATHIQLEKGEEYVYHVFGDSEAYEFTHKLNHLFFKPKADQADSNLTVITNLREYTFRISYHSEAANKALYKLVLKYPDSEAAQLAALKEKQTVQQAWQEGRPVAYNWQTYMKSGAMELAPIHAWDDGRHTSMQFAAHAELPTIYFVDAEGQESIPNYHMADSNTIVLHRTAAKWYLRLGGRVTAIQNQGFGQLAKPMETGTVSSEVVRLVVGEAAPVVPPAQSQMLNVKPLDLTVPGAAVWTSIPIPADSEPAITIQPLVIPSSGHSQTVPIAKSAAVTPSVQETVVMPGTELIPAQAEATVMDPALKPAQVAGNYQVRDGDTSLLPSGITISQGRTTFKFKAPDIPAISPIDDSGQEQIAGMHIESKNSVVVHAEADTWRLRKGQSSLVLERLGKPE